MGVHTDAIFHCCNCFNTMGSGVALAIRSAYPESYEADQKTKSGLRNKLGKFTVAECSDGMLIYNLYGQYNYGSLGRMVNYEAIYEAIENAILDLKSRGKCSIAIPYRMCCNQAGGDWGIIYAMLEKFFLNDGELRLVICRI